MNLRNLRFVLWIAVALVSGWFVLQRMGTQPGSETGLMRAGADLQIANPYLSLIAPSGEAFDTKRFRAAHQLIYFGFTFCPDVCPISARKMLVAEALYNQSSPKTPAHSLFITIDPERDTPEIMGIYADNLVDDVMQDFPQEERAAIAPDLTALTGARAQIDAAAKTFMVYAEKVEDDAVPEAYRFNHTDLIYWVRPDGRVQFFSPRQSASDIAAALQAAS